MQTIHTHTHIPLTLSHLSVFGALIKWLHDKVSVWQSLNPYCRHTVVAHDVGYCWICLQLTQFDVWLHVIQSVLLHRWVKQTKEINKRQKKERWPSKGIWGHAFAHSEVNGAVFIFFLTVCMCMSSKKWKIFHHRRHFMTKSLRLCPADEWVSSARPPLCPRPRGDNLETVIYNKGCGCHN